MVSEPIFRTENRTAMPEVVDIAPDAMQRARDRALLWRATTMAMESAFRFGEDLPVGATAAAGDWIVGRYFASDNRNSLAQMHAERMAILDAMADSTSPRPDTLVVTMEPCEQCQDFIATHPNIKRVGFGFTREEVATRGLVKPHAETIFDRAKRIGLPYQVVLIEDGQLRTVGEMLLDATSRDTITGKVQVDQESLSWDLINYQGMG